MKKQVKLRADINHAMNAVKNKQIEYDDTDDRKTSKKSIPEIDNKQIVQKFA